MNPNLTKVEFPDYVARVRSGQIAIDEEVITTLLNGLQDMNWPGAREAADELKIMGTLSQGAIKHALSSDDSIWHYWILTELGTALPKSVWLDLSPELLSIARVIDSECAHIEAIKILATNGIINDSEKLALVGPALASGLCPAEEYLDLTRSI